jgi:predicted secreted protein
MPALTAQAGHLSKLVPPDELFPFMDGTMHLSVHKRKRLLALTLGAAGCGLLFPAAAEVVAQEPAGKHFSHRQAWPQATLQAEAAAEIAHDTVRITLASEVSESSQTAVAAALAKVMDGVMAQAKGHANIKASTGNYSIWPMNDKDGKISNWRGRGEIVLQSSDFAAASELASKFADQMPISNLSFSVSPEARAKQEEALLESAAQAFRDRAQALATAFGFAGYSIKEINLGGAGTRFEAAPRMMMAAKAADSVAVPLEGGTERITVTVRGSIFLRSQQK